MKPGKEGGAILETGKEIHESAEALYEVCSEHEGLEGLYDRLIEDAVPPYEIDARAVSLIMEGLRITLARRNLAEDYRVIAENLLADFEALQAPGTQD